MAHGELSVSTYIRKCLDNEEEFEAKQLLETRLDSARDLDNALSELSEDDEKITETTIALSMADVLVAFLECLPEPVIPVSKYQAALEAAESNTVANVSEYKIRAEIQ